MNEYMSHKERLLFESCVIRGINHQTTNPKFDGFFNLKKIEPFILEGLPLYLTYKGCRMDGDEFIVVCSYKNEPFEIVFAP